MKIKYLLWLFCTVVFLSGNCVGCSATGKTYPPQPCETTPNWTMIDAEQLKTGRLRSSMTYDSKSNRAILFGGMYSDMWTGQWVRFNDTWEFDGTEWTLRETPVRPEARSGMEICYCPAWDATIMFGGNGGDPVVSFRDTWRYKDGAWEQLFPANKPGARGDFGMVFDESLQRIILYGGYNVGGGGSYTDVWTFDGTNWEKIANNEDPGPLDAVFMAYDAHRGKTILFGGHIGMTPNNRTFEFDGAHFVLVDTPTNVLPKRTFFGLCYDRFRKKTVLFGGKNTYPNNDFFNDTWEYDGNDWHHVETENSPSVRAYGRMVYMNHKYQSLYYTGKLPGHFDYQTETWVYSGVEFHTPALTKPGLTILCVLLSGLMLRRKV